MNADRRRAVAALATAGLLWGTTVPLSKLALGWLPPGWLTFVRFGLAAVILLPVASRPGVRAACTPSLLASGAVGYGGSVVVQNAGITRTSVTHAALLIGAAPVLVAIIAAFWHHTVARPVAWAGFAVSLAGVGLVTGGGGGGATAGGDGLVLASLLLSATFTVAQARLLRGHDPVAVTAVQFLGAALAVLPFSVVAEGMPAAPGGPGAVLATVGLAAGGTLLPFTLFAYGQSRVPAEVAGAFLNLEPFVGAVAGAVFFADPVGLPQVTGGAAILAGIALSSLPLLGADLTRRSGAGTAGTVRRRRRDGARPHEPRTTGAQPRSPATAAVAEPTSQTVRAAGARGSAARMAQDRGNHPGRPPGHMRWAGQIPARPPAPPRGTGRRRAGRPVRRPPGRACGAGTWRSSWTASARAVPPCLMGSLRPRTMTGGTCSTRTACWPSSGWPARVRTAGSTSDRSEGPASWASRTCGHSPGGGSADVAAPQAGQAGGGQRQGDDAQPGQRSGADRSAGQLWQVGER
jgi:drug/metabolite transporter (DMT)-like permease